jgi:hypothetical protein
VDLDFELPHLFFAVGLNFKDLISAQQNGKAIGSNVGVW